ncbi:DUF302 domain-containing protein [Pseudonocardia nigra]|uniref:DUF302 domain-containing protein n=1 Tax=Pseudonocardia nigra TaxID=1921578 RepID=UPI001C60314E|nr:DUF302 domain-containing protein [Pseudonocardia nigra]
MRHRLLTLTALAALTVAGCASPAGPAAAPDAPAPEPATAAPEVPGLVVHASAYDVAETSTRVQEALAAAGMVTAVVDHAANAASVGEQLRPTTLVIGGAPMAGSPVMGAAQTAGIDLPQKYLTWQAADGTVYLGHNSADYIGARAGIVPDSPALDALRMGSGGIAAAASGSEEPVSTGDATVDGEGYLVEQTADTTVAEAISRYQEAFVAAGLTPVATVDHTAGAAGVDIALRPTQVTLVGNPKVGTTLIQANQTMGIDLPVRYLAWQDETGTVHVGHPDIRVLAQRHGLSGVEDVLAMVENATAMFTATAAGG